MKSLRALGLLYIPSMHLLFDGHCLKDNGHSSVHFRSGSNKYVPSSFPCALGSRTRRADRQNSPLPCLVPQTYNTGRRRYTETRLCRKETVRLVHGTALVLWGSPGTLQTGDLQWVLPSTACTYAPSSLKRAKNFLTRYSGSI